MGLDAWVGPGVFMCIPRLYLCEWYVCTGGVYVILSGCACVCSGMYMGLCLHMCAQDKGVCLQSLSYIQMGLHVRMFLCVH